MFPVQIQAVSSAATAAPIGSPCWNPAALAHLPGMFSLNMMIHQWNEKMRSSFTIFGV